MSDTHRKTLQRARSSESPQKEDGLTHHSVVESVRQQLDTNGRPTRQQVESLLSLIDQLQAERQRERELVVQAQLDRNTYRTLIAAHEALVTTHTQATIKRERTEEALQTTEEHLHMLVEGVRDYAIFMLDPNGRIVSWNAGAERITGYRAEESLGRHFSYFYPVEDIQHGTPAHELQVAATEGRFEDEGWRVRKDGSRFWVNTVVTALRDEAGQLRGFAKVTRDITERKWAEQALRESEEWLQGIIHSAMDAIITVDADQRITLFNPAAERLFRCPAAEAIGQPLDRFIPERYRHAHREHIRAFGQTGVTSRSMGTLEPLTAVRADGEEFPIEAAISQVNIAGQKLYTVILRDITKRKQAEEALRESEERFRILFEHSPDAILLFDPHDRDVLWRIVDCNNAASRINGYTREEVAGQGIHLLSTGEPNPEGCAAYVERLRREGTIHGETVHRRKDGTLLPIEFSTSLITLGGQELVLGIDRDITERKQAEEALNFLAQASKLLSSSLDYETTFQSVARLAVPFLADGCFVGLLEADHSIQRLAIAHIDPAKEQVLRELYDRFLLDRQESHPILRVLQTGQPELISDISDSSLETVARDPEHLSLLRELGLKSAMIVPLVARGRTLGTIVFAVTESRRSYKAADLALAEELAGRAAFAVDNARLYYEAQQALQARDEFLSIAAHELKKPTTVLFGATQLLQQWGTNGEQSTPDRYDQVLRIAAEEAARLDPLIDSLVDFSNIQAGRFDLRQQPVNLCALAQRVVEELQPRSLHTISLMCTEESLIVEGDELRLERVLYNLLENAIKYSPSFGLITVQVGRQGDEACLAVRDQGIGIPEAAQPKIFQRFYRASNVASLSVNGMGIGLYLVKEIVTRHGGMVKVSSAEGLGSTFTVRLPLQAPAS